jgi:hypothetical protein
MVLVIGDGAFGVQPSGCPAGFAIGDGRRFQVESQAALARASPLLHDAAAPGEGAPQFRQVLERACDSTAFQPSSFVGRSDSLPFFGFSLRRCGGVSTWKWAF